MLKVDKTQDTSRQVVTQPADSAGPRVDALVAQIARSAILGPRRSDAKIIKLDKCDQSLIEVPADSAEISLILDHFCKRAGLPLDVLSREERAQKGEKPRIEFRKMPGTNRVANIALSFADGKERDAAYQEFCKICPTLSIASAGSTTLEIGVKGVDKGTPLLYVSLNLQKTLPRYTRGPSIDAFEHNTILALDGDGTLWGKPEKDRPPEENNLGNSPAQGSILSYLRAGGVVMIVSGNDPRRTVKRFLMGIPKDEYETLLPRVLIAAAGGHCLMTLTGDGQAELVEDYQTFGLTIQEVSGPAPTDGIYLGDDHKRNGNDTAGFKMVGFAHAACVTNETKLLPDSAPQEIVVPGETHAVKEIVDQILATARLRPGAPLFEGFSDMRSASKAQPNAHALVKNTLDLIGLQGVIDLIAYNDGRINAPVIYTKTKIDDLARVYAELTPDIKSMTLDADGIIAFSDALGAKLREQGKDPEEYQLVGNFRTDGTFEGAMKQALDNMDLKDGSVVRILEPGNNDQANPMYIAHQIRFIRKYAQDRGIRVNIQVIIMGQGGHATTASFPQIGEMKDGKFLGTPEALSLGITLRESLRESGISSSFVDTFSSTPAATVEIRMAVRSTNTGENVAEALKADLSDESRPQHLFVTSATTAATRQAQTFAQQYSANPKQPTAEKYYTTITSIPLPRSRRFIERAWDDKTRVMEMFAGLAERARLIFYAYGKGFIPSSPCIDRDEVTSLYATYHKLSGDDSKKVSIEVVLKFFQGRFSTMEMATTWNKDLRYQRAGTQGAMKAARDRYQQARS